ncbi:putative glutamylcysteine synthetase [Lachnospiraceae bacterium TWA4]|nr:putative glutamylcysteine synthetase [Lachnospiraceae bacterium TWA4]
MDLQQVKKKLYDKYISLTERERKSYIGIEIEIPIVNLKKEPVSFELVQKITKEFLKQFSFEVIGRDTEGYIYAAENTKTKDILSYDCSYNNLELSMGIGEDIHTLYRRFVSYYTWLQAKFNENHHALTGMGINPYRNYNNNIPIKNERYRMLFHHLGSYKDYFDNPMYFHRYPDFGLFSSASQVQLDVRKEDLITAIRAFSKVEPIKALLFSNSVLLDEREDILCIRDILWENSTHGINPHNIGMFEKIPESIEELQAYIESTSLYCVEREGVYINFPPIGVMDYFSQDKIKGEFYKDGGYVETEIIPELKDIEYLRTFKFEDLTFRGTIEFRSVCCQPISEAMTVAAFHVGLMEKLYELDKLMENDVVIYRHGYNASELRKLFIKRKLPGFVDIDQLYELAKKVVDLSKKGLESRGFKEEEYLDPLYHRIKNRTNPAEYLLSQREKGVSLEELILNYGKIK